MIFPYLGGFQYKVLPISEAEMFSLSQKKKNYYDYKI